MLWWKIRISNLRWCNPDLIPDLWFCSTSLYNSITLKLGDIFKTKAWLNFLNIKRNIKCCFYVISVFKIPNENIQHGLTFHYVEVKCKHGAGKFKIFNSKTTSNFSPTLSTGNRNSKSVEICLFIGFFEPKHKTLHWVKFGITGEGIIKQFSSITGFIVC